MLFVHETHHVVGSREDEFEAAWREGWMPLLGEGDDARLLWYCHHAHGSGPAYHVVSVTAVRDGAAWERLARRLADGATHELSIYMEDTGWPHRGRADDYVELAGSRYAPSLEGSGFLRMEAAFRPAFGSHRRDELVLMQKILDPDRLTRLLTTEIRPEHRAAGTWMHDALDVRDRWESRLLRTSAWSPLW